MNELALRRSGGELLLSQIQSDRLRINVRPQGELPLHSVIAGVPTVQTKDPRSAGGELEPWTLLRNS